MNKPCINLKKFGLKLDRTIDDIRNCSKKAINLLSLGQARVKCWHNSLVRSPKTFSECAVNNTYSKSTNISNADIHTTTKAGDKATSTSSDINSSSMPLPFSNISAENMTEKDGPQITNARGEEPSELDTSDSSCLNHTTVSLCAVEDKDEKVDSTSDCPMEMVSYMALDTWSDIQSVSGNEEQTNYQDTEAGVENENTVLKCMSLDSDKYDSERSIKTEDDLHFDDDDITERFTNYEDNIDMDDGDKELLDSVSSNTCYPPSFIKHGKCFPKHEEKKTFCSSPGKTTFDTLDEFRISKISEGGYIQFQKSPNELMKELARSQEEERFCFTALNTTFDTVDDCDSKISNIPEQVYFQFQRGTTDVEKEADLEMQKEKDQACFDPMKTTFDNLDPCESTVSNQSEIIHSQHRGRTTDKDEESATKITEESLENVQYQWKKFKKVRFSPHVEVHELLDPDGAYRKARRGQWMLYALERSHNKNESVKRRQKLDGVFCQNTRQNAKKLRKEKKHKHTKG